MFALTVCVFPGFMREMRGFLTLSQYKTPSTNRSLLVLQPQTTADRQGFSTCSTMEEGATSPSSNSNDGVQVRFLVEVGFYASGRCDEVA
jgi:hypothetical protein